MNTFETVARNDSSVLSGDYRLGLDIVSKDLSILKSAAPTVSSKVDQKPNVSVWNTCFILMQKFSSQLLYFESSYRMNDFESLSL